MPGWTSRTPWCITVDYRTLEDETVTIRDRDTTEQIRIRLQDVSSAVMAGLCGTGIENFRCDEEQAGEQ